MIRAIVLLLLSLAIQSFAFTIQTTNAVQHRHALRMSSSQYQQHPIDPTTTPLLAVDAMVPLARRMQNAYPDRFHYCETAWDKFSDGTDHIQYSPHLAGRHVLFLASFHNTSITLSQLQVFISLLQHSLIQSLTIVLPYYPVGTMERMTTEGQVATAATYAHMLSTLPRVSQPTRVMMYDVHTLQNRFYLHTNAVASLQTAIPVWKRAVGWGREGFSCEIDAIAFPDDGAAKRFAREFLKEDQDQDIIVCGKSRDKDNDDTRRVVLQDGDPKGKRVVVVDDLVQSGGTLYETAKVLLAAGAKSVSAYVTHAVFPDKCWKRFVNGGDRYGVFDRFWVTNSIPTVTGEIPTDSIFEVLDLTELIVYDLDHYHANDFDKQ